MGVIIGSARINEKGTVSGGKAGDQTRREVSTQAYYMHSKGWYCLRPKSISVANALADAMIEACNNNCIGYCQTHRTSVIPKLRAAGRLSKIKTNVETDCSELVRACCIQAGFDPGDFNTASEVKALNATNQFMAKISVTSSTTLYNGDILVTKSKGHTAIVVSGHPRRAASNKPKPSINTTAGDVVAAQHRNKNLAGSYSVTASVLILRTDTSTSSSDNIIARMKRGTIVNCYGYYNVDKNDQKWLYVDYRGTVGYASAKYLKK